jgi:diacylglycerol kinase (ATP)
MFIVNPRSGRGKAGERWPQIREILHAENYTFEVAFTQSRGRGTPLARTALHDGFELIVAVGGDGVVHEVVNGMIAEGKAVNPEASLGIIPCGTGNDLARMLGLPRKTLAAARHLTRSSQSRLIDVGEVISTVNGKSERRFFANDANLGFAAEVVERTERTGKFSRGTLPYFVALLLTALRHRNHDMTLRIDGRQFEGKMTTVLICNGQSTGGGMWVAPEAALDDGQFDVVVVGGLSPLEILWHAPKIYRGTHVAIRQVSVHRGRMVSVASPERLSVVADGELIGKSPATFRVLPAALRVRV